MTLYLIGKNRNGIQFFQSEAYPRENNKYAFFIDDETVTEETREILIDERNIEKFITDFYEFDYACISSKSMDDAKKLWNETLNKFVEQHLREVHKYESMFIRDDDDFLNFLERTIKIMDKTQKEKIKNIVNTATDSLEP